MTETTIDTTIGVTGQAVDRARLDYVPLQSSAQAPAPTAAQASARWNGGIIPMSLRRVHFLMPGGVDDPSVPSGGNAYDRRVCLDLPGFGWQVERHAVAGD